MIPITLQVDPLTTALGFVHLQCELAFSPDWSLYVGPSIKAFGGLLAEEGDIEYLGLGGEMGLRYYFSGNAPRGAWALVRGVLATLSADGLDNKLGGYVSALGGYTWIVDDRWVFALGLGVQYIDYEIGNAGSKGVLPAAHTAIGVAF